MSEGARPQAVQRVLAACRQTHDGEALGRATHGDGDQTYEHRDGIIRNNVIIRTDDAGLSHSVTIAKQGLKSMRRPVGSGGSFHATRATA